MAAGLAADPAAAATPEGDGESVLEVPLAWLGFCCFIFGAAVVDLLFLSRPAARLPPCLASRLGSAPAFARQIVFWLLAGALFNVFVWGLMGREAAGAWLYGYILEYVLSVDNLFVFQAVFRSYSTPPQQVDRALFWGISAAVLLRLAFFGVGTELLSMGLLARCAFGLALIYSGVKTLRSSDDEDDEDPAKNPVVRCISRLLPVHEGYADGAAFFVRVPDAHAKGGRRPPSSHPRPVRLGCALEDEDDTIVGDTKLPQDVSAEHKRGAALECEEGRAQHPLGALARGRWKVTPLFLVVVTLGVIDVIFAVDSVTAKISSISGMRESVSLFLNLSSSAFAMFVLRSLFAVISVLSSMFRFLGYGVGVVLVLIGVKLILSGYVEVGMAASCALILAILSVSILASVILPAPAVDAPQELPVEDGAGKLAPDAAEPLPSMVRQPAEGVFD